MDNIKLILEYKGYHAHIKYDKQDHIFVGEVINIDDFLSFHSDSVKGLKNKFIQCIDICNKIKTGT